MNYNINKRIKQIEIENYIWIVYIFIIFLSFYANSLEKDFFISNNQNSKDTYRKINAVIFTVLIIVYGYFENDAIKSFREKDKSLKKKQYDTLILIASSAILVSGFIFLYVILSDDNLEEEIAFN